MKRILIYTENYEAGGGNKYMVDIINSIPEGINLVIASNKNGVYKNDFSSIKRPYSYYPLNVKTFVNLLSKLEITKTQNLIISIFKQLLFLFIIPYYKFYNSILFKRILKKEKPNLVLSCNGGFPAALSCLDLVNTSFNLKISVILSVVSLPQIKKKWLAIFYPNICSRITHLLVNSSKTKENFISYYDFNPNIITIVYNSIEIKKIEIYSEISENEILQYKNKNEILIGYIGRIDKMKGIQFLIDSFYKLTNELQNVRLILVGKGDDYDRIKSHIYKLGLSDKIITTGYYHGNIRDLLQIIDIFAFPSLWEGFPYSILEAMECEKLIVSTDVGSIPEAIKDNENGFLTEPGNTIKLFETLKKAVINYNSYEHIRKRARETIIQRFNQPRFSDEINSLIKPYLLKQ